MAKPCDKQVRSNPFNTYRDPKTGEWIVILPPKDKESTPKDKESTPTNS